MTYRQTVAGQATGTKYGTPDILRAVVV